MSNDTNIPEEPVTQETPPTQPTPKPENRTIPPLGKGWKSNHQLVGIHHGDSTQIRRELLELQEKLVQEKIAEGMNETEASTFVEDNYIGIRKPVSSGPAALSASPEAVARLTPYAEETWLSGSGLRREHGGGNMVWKKRLEGLQSRFIDEKMNEGMSKYEATNLVESELIGTRQNPRGGQPTLYASPQAIDTLLQERGRSR